MRSTGTGSGKRTSTLPRSIAKFQPVPIALK
jgi:hypothetical protein